MAGDWIKMRKDLADDPAVIAIAASCQIGEDLVVGKLHRAWSWADSHTINGNAHGVTLCWLDRYVGVPNFAQAMCKSGWLSEIDGGISFPNFDRHNGKSAKRRALTANRVRNARSVTSALPEKRREEKSISSFGTNNMASPDLSRATVEQVAAYCRERGNSVDAQAFVDFYESKGWMIGKNKMRDWRAAVRTWEKNQNGSAQGNPPAVRQPTASREQERIDRNLQMLAEFAASGNETRIFQSDGGPRRIEANG